jgi:hypothetical protein
VIALFDAEAPLLEKMAIKPPSKYRRRSKPCEASIDRSDALPAAEFHLVPNSTGSLAAVGRAEKPGAMSGL